MTLPIKMSDFWKRLRTLTCTFFAARRANVTITFALAIIPVVGSVGAAVDYSRANSARTAMQSALDSTALMLSKNAAGLPNAQLKTIAYNFFASMYNYPEVTNIVITPTLASPSAGSYSLNVSGSGKLKTTFVNLLGMTEITIGAKSEVLWGMKRLELALALDNTGSMAWNGKIVELKKAVTSLLDTLKKAAKKPDDIKVALVPFDTTVRLDQDYKSPAPWVSFDNFGKNKDTWIGCVEDRDQSNDVLDTTPVVGTSATLYPAVPCSNNGALVKMLPLTNDWDALKIRVNQMNPNGNTNVTIGLVWGWHALTANLPFTEASPPKPDLDKVIILLTDGQNTQNRWSSNSTTIDKRTKAACDNIKAANIKLYTIRVIDGNSTLLSQCATNTSMYYNVQQASQLNAVFSAIAQNLANLRIAK
ncbi:MAG: VWA domain-containing protein [Rhizobiales bacterium]|nr:VWA domain-containing protein [Hyphomicrobiales bacterium]